MVVLDVNFSEEQNQRRGWLFRGLVGEIALKQNSVSDSSVQNFLPRMSRRSILVCRSSSRGGCVILTGLTPGERFDMRTAIYTIS